MSQHSQIHLQSPSTYKQKEVELCPYQKTVYPFSDSSRQIQVFHQLAVQTARMKSSQRRPLAAGDKLEQVPLLLFRKCPHDLPEQLHGTVIAETSDAAVLP